jgi:hypothetical protein
MVRQVEYSFIACVGLLMDHVHAAARRISGPMAYNFLRVSRHLQPEHSSRLAVRTKAFSNGWCLPPKRDGRQ